MLLQTFIQLHILLATTPGLVGWALFVPATQALPAHIVYLTAQKPLASEVPETALQASDTDPLHVSPYRLPSASTALPTSAESGTSGFSTPDRLPRSVSLSNHSPRAP